MAFEILTSEQEYMFILKGISEVYVKQLKASISFNRQVPLSFFVC